MCLAQAFVDHSKSLQTDSLNRLLCGRSLHRKCSESYRTFEYVNNDRVYGLPFSHLFTELHISPIEVHISKYADLEISPIQLKTSAIQFNIIFAIQLDRQYFEISPVQLKISAIQLKISAIQ